MKETDKTTMKVRRSAKKKFFLSSEEQNNSERLFRSFSDWHLLSALLQVLRPKIGQK